jgi:hypothetical protein
MQPRLLQQRRKALKNQTQFGFDFYETSKKLFKNLSVCFENSAMGCTILFPRIIFYPWEYF